MRSLQLSIRRFGKRGIERALSSVARVGLAANRRQRTIVLALHNVVPDLAKTDQLDASLHITRTGLHSLLEVLSEARGVSLASRPTLSEDESDAPLRVLLTFDDAYAGALTVGFPVLRDFNAAAVVFVAPGLLGSGVPWWDQVASRHATSGNGNWQSFRSRALAPPLAGKTEAVLREVGGPNQRFSAELMQYCVIASETQLRTAIAMGPHAIGCHTWSHCSLDALPAQEINHELRLSARWIADSGLPSVPWHAYPYGRWNDLVLNELELLEYETAFLIHASPRRTSSPFLHPRINVPNLLSAEGLLIRLAQAAFP